MNDLCKFVSEHFFCLIYLAALKRSKSFYLIHREEGEKSQAFFNIFVAHVSPVLVEFIGRCFFGIKPNGALFGFAHLFALAVGKKLECHTVGGLVFFSSYKIYAAKDI